MVLEYARVKILPEFTKEDFKNEASKVSSEFIAKQPGFISHKSFWSKDDEWVDLIEWESLEDAEAASSKIESTPICLNWMKMMDPEHVHMEHLSLV